MTTLFPLTFAIALCLALPAWAQDPATNAATAFGLK